MSRAERLLALMELLRQRRAAVSGETLAADLGISLRSLYRDIASLRAQGAVIEGEAGVGFRLRSGFTLPPLMFSEEEIEAIVLGSRHVADAGDAGLVAAARSALAKIAAVLPPPLGELVGATTLLVGPKPEEPSVDDVQPAIREAVRRERKLEIAYINKKSVASTRVIWPFALGYFSQVRVLLAWCELRQDFRAFRLDRLQSFSMRAERYPRNRLSLLSEWRTREGIENADSF